MTSRFRPLDSLRSFSPSSGAARSAFDRLPRLAAVLAVGAAIVAPGAASAQFAPYGQAVQQNVQRQVSGSEAAETARQKSDLNWAEAMFSELEHDFGDVAAGADVKHQLVLENPYEETVRIVGVDKTCGCTQAKVSAYEIPTHESATIDIAMDTLKFRDEKKSNVVVTLAFTAPSGQTAQETVRVPIRAFIRKDVVLEPGAANFGQVEAGVGGEQTLTVKYAGRPDWAITGVESASEHVTATLGERMAVAGGVRYQLSVRLDEKAPIGSVDGRVLLRTNDPGGAAVPVLVSATVEPDIVVTPARVPLGSLRPGQRKTVSVVLRGRRPFEIDGFACTEHEGAFTTPTLAGTKRIHIIPLTVTAPDESGEMEETFEVSVAGRDEPITFQAYGRIE